jgi:hypothetical protein
MTNRAGVNVTPARIVSAMAAGVGIEGSERGLSFLPRRPACVGTVSGSRTRPYPPKTDTARQTAGGGSVPREAETNRNRSTA